MQQAQKILYSLSLVVSLLFSFNSLASVTHQEDKNFMSVNLDVWMNSPFQNGLQNIEEVVGYLGSEYERYLENGLPEEQFAHSKEAYELTFFIMEKGLDLARKAETKIQDEQQFLNYFEDVGFNFRKAILYSTHLQEIKTEVLKAYKKLLNDFIQDPDDGTVREKGFILQLFYAWEKLMIAADQSDNPPSNPKEIYSQAQSSYEVTLNQLAPNQVPSERSLKTAQLFIESILKATKSALVCSSDDQEFENMHRYAVVRIYQGLEADLKADKSLASITQNINEEYKYHENLIQSCLDE